MKPRIGFIGLFQALIQRHHTYVSNSIKLTLDSLHLFRCGLHSHDLDSSHTQVMNLTTLDSNWTLTSVTRDLTPTLALRLVNSCYFSPNFTFLNNKNYSDKVCVVVSLCLCLQPCVMFKGHPIKIGSS